MINNKKNRPPALFFKEIRTRNVFFLLGLRKHLQASCNIDLDGTRYSSQSSLRSNARKIKADAFYDQNLVKK